MNTIGISLGWNCYAATYGVTNNIRIKKENGYKTCPFDECVSNYHGIIKCINDDFKFFCDDSYLEIIKAPEQAGHIPKGELLLYNTYYNFIFTHESPGYANLYIQQEWPGGKSHYIDNNYHFFKERYTRRIQNFRNYINSSQGIKFIISSYRKNTLELDNCIKNTYARLKYDILHIEPEALVTKDFLKEHLIIMNLSNEQINEELNEELDNYTC
jgi:hypothetical protein